LCFEEKSLFLPELRGFSRRNCNFLVKRSSLDFLVRLHQGKPALAGSLIPLKRNKKMKQKDKKHKKALSPYSLQTWRKSEILSHQ